MVIPRKRNKYEPGSAEPFKLSRSKLELFLDCPKCFYLDRRLGISRPRGPAFLLNTAVDTLLKKEFDLHRSRNEPHDLMKRFGVDAVPFTHDELAKWRENFVGVQYLHGPTNLLITGAVDDVWVNPEQELIVVDYKSTSVNGEVTLEGKWKESYKRQIEIYQWLLRRKGFNVSKRAYFVYANGNTELDVFDAKLEFILQLLPYDGDDSWVDNLVFEVKRCLDSPDLPASSETCEFCPYRNEAGKYDEAREAQAGPSSV